MATKKPSEKPSKAVKQPAKKAVKLLKKAVPKTARKAAKKAVAKAEPKEPERPFDPAAHFLVPKHELMSEKELTSFFEMYDLQPTSLPTILVDDPAIRHLVAKMGDIIRITRKSHTSGRSVFYRRVAYE